MSAQKIEGSVISNDEPIPSANVLLKNQRGNILQYTFTDEKGKYAFLLKSSLDSILILAVNSMAHEPEEKPVRAPSPGKTLVVDFHIQERVTALKEVLVKSKKTVTKRGDTITFNINAFKDGTERVVEDLLKKLPGITVEENGVIKFKGKKIEAMLLGDDDLFGNQYAIGSKNIAINMIDSIQAIENYLENPLLKGLKDSDEVALNLVLKKGKTDFSGNAKLGYGYQDKYSAKSTGLLVNKKSKGFLLAYYNNTGENHSPLNIIGGTTASMGDFENKDLQAPALIFQGDFSSELKEGYSTENNSLYFSENFMHEFSPDFTAKLNLVFFNDQLERKRITDFFYFLDEDTLSVNEINRMKLTPRFYDAKFVLSDKRNSHFIWSYMGRLSYQETGFKNLSTKNDFLQNNRVSTINFFTNHHLDFTYRKKENSAFEGKILYAKSRTPQNFLLVPGVDFLSPGMDMMDKNTQISRFDRESFELELKYHQKYKNFKWILTGGYNFHNDFLRSSLYQKKDGTTVLVGQQFQNLLEYRKSMPNIKINATYKPHQKHKFNFGVKARVFDFKLKDTLQNIFLNDHYFSLTPHFNYSYSINDKSKINFSFSHNEEPQSSQYLYSGVILLDYRNLRDNQPQFKLLKTQRYGISYRYQDFIRLTKLWIGFRGTNKENGYYFKNSIDLDKIITTAFFLDAGNENYSVFLNAERYLHFFRTTFTLEGSYNWDFNKNLINNSDLRDIRTESLHLDFGYTTGFNSPINFYGSVEYFWNIYFVEGERQNTFSSLKGSLTSTYKPSQVFYLTSNLNYIHPNLSKERNYLFLDMGVHYQPKESRFEYSIIGRNLTGIDEFKSISISDYSTIISSYPLLKPSIMAKVRFYF